MLARPQALRPRSRPPQPSPRKCTTSSPPNAAPTVPPTTRPVNLTESAPALLDRAGQLLGVKSLADWYNVTGIDVLRLNEQNPSWWTTSMKHLLRRHHNSLSSLLMASFPDHPWVIWKFQTLPHKIWARKENRRAFFDYLAPLLGITHWEQWYNASHQKARDLGGGTLLSKYYRSSLALAVMDLYPEHQWVPWMFDPLPYQYWKNRENMKRYFLWLANRLGFSSLPDDLYKIQIAHLRANYGSTVVSSFNHTSLISALQFAFPDHEWVDWKFSKTPPSFWMKQNNQKEFLRWLARELKIPADETADAKALEAWYSVSIKSVIDNGGAGLLLANGGSLYSVLKEVYPLHHWQPWRFVRTPKGLWETTSVRREFMDEVAKQLKFTTLDDWYGVTQDQVIGLGAGTIINNYYNNSLITALQSLYSEHKWEPWKFSKLPKDYFRLNLPKPGTKRSTAQDQTNSQSEADEGPDSVSAEFLEFLEQLASKLGIRSKEDWYRVSNDQVDTAGGSTIRHQLSQVLLRAYPDYPWDSILFTSRAKASKQFQLLRLLESVLPGYEILEEFAHPHLPAPFSLPPFSNLDIYIPGLRIAFEYHGKQHYEDLHLRDQADAVFDEKKAEACRKIGIALITLPHWENTSPESIIQTLVAARPDLALAFPFGFFRT